MPWTVAALNKVLRPTLMHSIVTIAVNGSTSLLPTAAIPGADCCNSECVANLFQPRLLQMSRPKLLPAISASLHFNDAVPQRSRHTVAPFCCKCRRRSRCDVAATVGLYCLALITVSFSLLQVRHRLQLLQRRPHTFALSTQCVWLPTPLRHPRCLQRFQRTPHTFALSTQRVWLPTLLWFQRCFRLQLV